MRGLPQSLSLALPLTVGVGQSAAAASEGSAVATSIATQRSSVSATRFHATGAATQANAAGL